jgi:carbamoyltransferase
MIILGLHFGHDGSACIVKDGKLITAISAERITRVKKFYGVTENVLQYIFDAANITLNDIDAIALSDYDDGIAKNILESVYLDGELIKNTYGKYNDNFIRKASGYLLGKETPVYIVAHHLAHCSSVFYTSNFQNAYCFSMDSSYGSTLTNSVIAFANNNKIEIINHPNMMIGVGYAEFTQKLNLGNPIYKAGSTMGLASYGIPHEDIKKNIKQYVEESYFNNRDAYYLDYYRTLWKKLAGQEESLRGPDTPKGMMLAASIQYLFEHCVLDVVNKFIGDKTDNLCLSGGSFLNCNANSFIKQNTHYNIAHFPACGDDGVSVGSALYVAHHVENEPRHTYAPQDICYLGKKYEPEECDYHHVAKKISEGKIVAWFMGSSEYGPRALGHRSILADPRNFHNREILNFVVKNREWFRPFAPAILEEKCSEWFEFDDVSPFMLYTAKVVKPDQIPAVTHIDGTARMQTVNEDTNPAFYKLINEFEKITGVPILINTSLNGNGEPILESEQDAINFLESSNIDILVLNGKIIYKNEK